MNYDSSISDEVSLSTILDDMIVDGTDIEVIVQFLKQHEKDIKEIFSESMFVFDLYDLVAHPLRENKFLLDHMHLLPNVDFFFAGSQYSTLVFEAGWDRDNIKAIRENSKGFNSKIYTKMGYYGIQTDREVIYGELTLQSIMKERSTKESAILEFLNRSVLSRSVFMARNFLSLDITAQAYIIASIVGYFNSNEYHGSSTDRFIANRAMVYSHFVLGLLKQLLFIGDIDTFNFIHELLMKDEPKNWDYFDRSMRYFSIFCADRLVDRFGKKLNFNAWDKEKGVADLVFDLGLSGGEVNPIDVFLYIYIYNSRLFKELEETPDLIDLLNLGFNWQELGKFSSKPPIDKVA